MKTAEKNLIKTMLNALPDNKNEAAAAALRTVLSHAVRIETVGYQVTVYATLDDSSIPAALGLAAVDHEGIVNTLCTHDLRSCVIRDLGAMVTQIRLA